MQDAQPSPTAFRRVGRDITKLSRESLGCGCGTSSTTTQILGRRSPQRSFPAWVDSGTSQTKQNIPGSRLLKNSISVERSSSFLHVLCKCWMPLEIYLQPSDLIHSAGHPYKVTPSSSPYFTLNTRPCVPAKWICPTGHPSNTSKHRCYNTEFVFSPTNLFFLLQLCLSTALLTQETVQAKNLPSTHTFYSSLVL